MKVIEDRQENGKPGRQSIISRSGQQEREVQRYARKQDQAIQLRLHQLMEIQAKVP